MASKMGMLNLFPLFIGNLNLKTSLIYYEKKKRNRSKILFKDIRLKIDSRALIFSLEVI